MTSSRLTTPGKRKHELRMWELARTLATFAILGPLMWWALMLTSGELTGPRSLMSEVQLGDVFYRRLMLGYQSDVMLLLLSYAYSWMLIAAVATGLGIAAAGASRSCIGAGLIGFAVGAVFSAAMANAVYESKRTDLIVMSTAGWIGATLVCWFVLRRMSHPRSDRNRWLILAA